MRTLMTNRMVENVAFSSAFAVSVVSSSSNNNNSWSVSSNSNGKAPVLNGSLPI